MASKKTTAPAEEAKPAVITLNTAPNLWKIAFIILAGCWALCGVKGCAANIHQRFADWKQSVIDRLVPSPPNPFDFEKRERKTRPDSDQDDGRGIIWRFTRGVGGSGSLGSWVKKNMPAGAQPKTVYDVADAFYDAADRIAENPEIDEPNEAVAAVRGRLYGAADESWVPFLRGLDQQANTFGVESIADVIEFYYTIAGALYNAAEKASAPSGPEPAQQPPSEPAALPEPAEPGASPTACPGGNCPNQAPRYNYNYGYGWRWF